MDVDNTKIGVPDCKIDDDDGEGIFQIQEAQSQIPPGSMASIGPLFFRTTRQRTSDEIIKHYEESLGYLIEDLWSSSVHLYSFLVDVKVVELYL
ncbi:hypothetical protein LOK49_LG08G02315 [Camellia lanceoleosa]|uniref:Uncharacterized protein n=1 Tax=Camellia lanceoleosa TaxID=1840588 RepID=A0ACC0GT18_9ERIC|nr:hypothetical protein LOK49_LG08G02315 [Camellia lanceoleosa]